jgi:hypothetical protein
MEETYNISFPVCFWMKYRATRVLTHKLWTTWTIYIFFIGGPSVILIIALLKGIDLSKPGVLGLPGWEVLLGGPAFVFIFLPLGQMFQIWSIGRRNRTATGMQKQSFTPDGFSTSGDAFEVNLKWDAINKATETKDFFFLHYSARGAYYVPKARISTIEDMSKLRRILHANLKDRARLLSPT